MPRDSRFRKRDSDRSGFTYVERRLVYDGGVLVGPEERDASKPTSRSLGGEGEISEGDVRANADSSYDTPTENDYTIHYINSTNGITFQRKSYSSGEITNLGWLKIAGSNGSVTINKNPQMTAGNQGDIATLECVGSNVVLTDGSGMDLRTGAFDMSSGDVITFMYQTDNSVWQELSRGRTFGSLGEY
jgi:hypothetical protein